MYAGLDLGYNVVKVIGEGRRAGFPRRRARPTGRGFR
jgi:hypothetical protein